MDISVLIALISLAVALVGLLITIVEKWHIIVPRLSALNNAICGNIRSVDLSRSRRYFLSTSIVGLAGGIITYSFKLFDMACLIKANRWSRYSKDKRFIVNKNNGTIHLKGICDDHLPQAITTVNSAVTSHIHGDKRQQITKAVLNNLPEDIKEELLIEAIKKSPTSTHLYNFLIKLWGQQKNYSKIHEFLFVSIRFLNSKLSTASSDKSRRKYTKAIRELQEKKNHAEYLASISKLS